MTTISDVQHILLLFFAFALMLVGVATSGWATGSVFGIDFSYGLFRSCKGDYCYRNDGQKLAKSMTILGLIAALACAVLMSFHYGMKSSSSFVKSFPKIVFFTSLGGAGCAFVGCAVYGFDHYSLAVYPSYSFVLYVIGTIILIVGGSASGKK